jgi:hypothetical protein
MNVKQEFFTALENNDWNTVKTLFPNEEIKNDDRIHDYPELCFLMIKHNVKWKYKHHVHSRWVPPVNKL